MLGCDIFLILQPFFKVCGASSKQKLHIRLLELKAISSCGKAFSVFRTKASFVCGGERVFKVFSCDGIKVSDFSPITYADYFPLLPRRTFIFCRSVSSLDKIQCPGQTPFS